MRQYNASITLNYLETYLFSQQITDTNTILRVISHIVDEGVKNPFIHPPTIVKAVKMGILDAASLKGLSTARGEIKTAIINEKCLSVIRNTGKPIQEKERENEIL
ncbi:MAG: hypothetical protein ACFFAE_12950 [Candidatus Hodarchaeota archaeon]